jgi:elongation factor P
LQVACRGLKERAGKSVRPGVNLVLDNVPHRVTKITQGKRGKGGGFVKATLKNLSTGYTRDRTFTSDETVEHADMERQVVQYSWADASDDSLVFLNTETFEEVRVAKAIVDNAHWLVEGQLAKVLRFRDTVLGVEIPVISEYSVVAVDPSREHGGNQMGKLETGHELWVPLFIKEGTRVRVNTEDNLYVDRAP